MKTKRQYLIVDTRKYRRHSAPENLGSWFAAEGRQSSQGRSDQGRASVSDFSVLLENQSESGSSLELDTSNWSRDFSPDATTKTTPTDSYQNLPAADVAAIGRSAPDDHCRGHGSWPMWKNFLLSQAIAGCMAVMETSNASFRRDSRNSFVNALNLPHYILLGVFWTTRLALRNDGRDIVQVIKYSGLRYLFLSLLHVEANYLLVSSFRHGTYLGNQTIDCTAAALCLVVAYVCLEVRFHSAHAVGFTLSMLGCAGLCLANAIQPTRSREDVLLGDILRVAGGICLALNSTAQEIVGRSIDIVEYLAMIGLMGSIICGFQAMAWEAGGAAPGTSGYWITLVGHSAAQFLCNSLAPKVLGEMGATGLHLALTASGVYSCLLDVYRFDQWEPLHLLSYAAALAGSILFFSKRTVTGVEPFFPLKVIITKAT